MNELRTKTMRDALIEQICERMSDNERIFFLSADMGAPALDRLRQDFGERFINVGIAEQNLVNVAAGLALEGFIVYAYGIAAFVTMRAFEQIRTNLALLSQQRPLNVNLVGVGTGVSYEMSGPSHHCLEDIALIRTLPNIMLFSPSDWVMTEKFVDLSMNLRIPKYLRLDGKPLAKIYDENRDFDWEKGFCELLEGTDICFVSTGYTTHRALKVARTLQASGRSIGLVDVFMLASVDRDRLFDIFENYKYIFTIEEAFIGTGGLDSLVAGVLQGRDADIKVRSFGFSNSYVFKSGSRDFLAMLNDFDDAGIIRIIEQTTN
jgi:transketolase